MGAWIPHAAVRFIDKLIAVLFPSPALFPSPVSLPSVSKAPTVSLPPPPLR